MAARNPISKTFVWILLGLLFAGLAGFGATNLSGTVRTVGRVGDQLINVDQFARDLQNEINAVASQTGDAVTFRQAQELGLDRLVLQRLVTIAAIDHETAQIGLSIGDENLQELVTSIAAFHGLDGHFDPEAYRFTLENAGIEIVDFEEDLRQEAARNLVQNAIREGTVMPAILSNLFLEHYGARRTVTWARLGADLLDTPLREPTQGELKSFYTENIENYTLPAVKKITYVKLLPTDLVDNIAIEEDTIRSAYKARTSEFNQPERRLVERLVYIDEDAASKAKSAVENGDAGFEDLVTERGLDLADVDLGDVSANDLGTSADDVFKAEVGDVIGPLTEELGFALYRVNAILDAQTIRYEDVRDTLHDELTLDQARRQIETLSQSFEDLLAAGATLEELASQTEMTLGNIDWTQDSLGEIAAYVRFREVASNVTEDDFPTIDFLNDGGIFALRLNETRPPQPQPFADAEDQVERDQRQMAIQDALTLQAEELIVELGKDADFTTFNLSPNTEVDLTRRDRVENTPLNFTTDVFTMNVGDFRIIPSEGEIILVRLDEIKPADTTGNRAALRDRLNDQLSIALGQALFTTFVEDVQIRTDPQIDERAVNAVMTSYQ